MTPRKPRRPAMSPEVGRFSLDQRRRRDSVVTEIAHERLGCDLGEDGGGRDPFCNVALDGLRDALRLAYAAGRSSETCRWRAIAPCATERSTRPVRG